MQLIKRNMLSITFIVLSFLVLGVSIFSLNFISHLRDSLVESINERLYATTTLAKKIADYSSDTLVAQLDQFQDVTDMESPEYIRLKEMMDIFCKENNIEFLVYYRIIPGNMDYIQPVIDNDYTEDSYSLGIDPIQVEEAIIQAIDGYTVTTILGVYSPEYDGLISGYSPLYRHSGSTNQIAYIVDVDIVDTTVLANYKLTNRIIVVSLVSVSILFITGLVNFVWKGIIQERLLLDINKQELIASLSLNFLEEQPLNKLLINSLSKVGKFFRLSKSVFYEFDQTTETFFRTICWYGSKQDTEDRNVKDWLNQLLLETFVLIREKKCVYGSTENPKYKQFIEDKINSVIWSPIFVKDDLYGVMSFETKSFRKWSKYQKDLVDVISNIICRAITQNTIKNELNVTSSIVSNFQQYIGEIDNNGKVLFANEKIKSLFSANELKEKGLELVFSNLQMNQIVNSFIPEVIKRGKLEYVLPIVDVNGDERMIHCFFFVIPEVSDAIGLIGIDITDRIKLEKEKDEMFKKVEQLAKTKTEFLANMSHEIRTPMNAIIGMTEIAKDTDELERKDYCLDRISEASVHLLGVINDILDISKIEANKLSLSNVEFHFEKMINKVVNVSGYKIAEKNLILSVNIDPKIPEYVIGDDQRLTQTITNLLSNAVKFTNVNGSIWINASLISDVDDKVEINFEVIDNGIGMSEEQQSNLFTIFSQGDSSISRKYGGTGLGLAISKGIVGLMGGTIRVTSKTGEGSNFSFNGIFEKPKSIVSDTLTTSFNWVDGVFTLIDNQKNDIYIFEELRKNSYFTLYQHNDLNDYYNNKVGSDVIFLLGDLIEPGDIVKIKKNDVNAKLVVLSSQKQWNSLEKDKEKLQIDSLIVFPIFKYKIIEYLNYKIAKVVDVDKDYGDPEEGIFEGKTILVAEDNEINQEILSALLEVTKVNIIFANNGVEAVSKYKELKKKINLILMDVQMPEMDGYTATMKIRSLEKGDNHMIIIAMTANVMKEDVAKCLEVGMDYHLGKPINIKEIISLLKVNLLK